MAASKTIYCPYTGQDYPKEILSQEHIFPRAIGGNQDFSILVARSVNSAVGADIDGMFAEQEYVKFFRTRFGLAGHSEQVPVLRITEEVDIPKLGKRDLEIEIKQGHIETHLPMRKTRTDNPQKIYLSGGSLEEVLAQIKKIRERAERKGVPIKILDQEEGAVPLPKQFSVQGSPYVCYRFMAKVAVAAAMYHFGDTIRSWPRVDRLRNIVRLPKDGYIDTDTELIEVKWFIGHDKKYEIENLFPHSHVVWFSQTRLGLHVYISVFGVIVARALLSESQMFPLTVQDKIFICNYDNGKFESHNGQLYLELRGIEELSPERFFCLLINKSWFE